jgi:hypothetical protein
MADPWAVASPRYNDVVPSGQVSPVGASLGVALGLSVGAALGVSVGEGLAEGSGDSDCPNAKALVIESATGNKMPITNLAFTLPIMTPPRCVRILGRYAHASAGCGRTLALLD